MHRSALLWLSRVAALCASPACFAHFADFKSPGDGMHFFVGQDVIVFADLFDDNNIHGVIVCPSGQTLVDNNNVPGPAQCSGGGTPTGWPQLQVLVDGQPQIDSVTQSVTVPGTTDLDANMNPDPIDFHRFSLAGLAVGTHEVKVRGLFAPPPASDGAVLDGPTITVTIDPLPSGLATLNLDQDISGAVNWNGLIVLGHGHVVDASDAVTIKDCVVIGLGSMTTDGITGSATAIDIERSIFEATGAIELTAENSAVLADNEFRANNLLTFRSSNPDVAPVLTLHGRTAATKRFQGNRIGAGLLVFDDTSHWLVGGDGDAQSNILIGPRATMNFTRGTSDVVVRGNYDHHNYRGGWSQGFNLVFSNAQGANIVVEHNVLRGSSWPVQDVTGEFRYNLVYGFGHTWIRGAAHGASIHHNVFAPEEGGGEVDQGIWLYGGESGVRIYNNTFDGGGDAVSNNGAGGEFPFAAPVVQVNNASRVTSLRNNLMTYTRDFQNGPGTPHVVGDAGTYGSVDYNAFYSPDNSTHDNYAVAGMVEGVTPGFALHDVSAGGATGVVDAQLAQSPFAAPRIYPYDTFVDEAAVWNRTQKVSAILAAFRAHYTPAPGSPVIDAGDPADDDARGRRADVGAIDAGGHDLDRFGTFGSDGVIFANGFDPVPA
ncbi:MAG TPA: hypothetical protein VFS55_02140, partial [Dokdonella sp.]|nr:hypothetical protein [Dokdonella sp.]